MSATPTTADTFGFPLRRVAAAAGLPISRETVRRWVTAGILPHQRIGSRVFVRPEDLRRVALGGAA